MSLRIAGAGWITPLGSGSDEVWQRLLAGDTASAETLTSPISERTYEAFRVPASAVAGLPSHPRLRRSSAISRFAAAAGLAALNGAAPGARTAIIFAISNGGVIYTKRFYHDVVETGAQAASPLLFPETVFNAPASHLAAILGITGASYTLVGDGAVGLLAIKMAEDMLAAGSIDECLVVAAEEADWLLCDAYRKWRLMRSHPPIEPFRTPAKGMILSEGAGAVLLTHDRGDVAIERTHGGGEFARQREAAALVRRIIEDLADPEFQLLVASANGTFIDAAERSAISAVAPEAHVYTPKPALGEGVAAGSLWQVICAVQALRSGRIPGVPGEHALASAVVSTCGLNQQAAGLRLARALF